MVATEGNQSVQSEKVAAMVPVVEKWREISLAG
jgi:hypothetical protein